MLVQNSPSDTRAPQNAVDLCTAVEALDTDADCDDFLQSLDLSAAMADLRCAKKKTRKRHMSPRNEAYHHLC